MWTRVCLGHGQIICICIEYEQMIVCAYDDNDDDRIVTNKHWTQKNENERRSNGKYLSQIVYRKRREWEREIEKKGEIDPMYDAVSSVWQTHSKEEQKKKRLGRERERELTHLYVWWDVSFHSIDHVHKMVCATMCEMVRWFACILHCIWSSLVVSGVLVDVVVIHWLIERMRLTPSY